MSGLDVEFRHHGTRRELFCVVCGGLFHQECVAVALVRDGWSIGEVCPRCLGEGAGQGIRRLRLRARRLTERAQQVRGRGGNAGLVHAALEQARWLESLAEQLPDAWDLTPVDLKEAEMSALRDLFPGLPEAAVFRLVDGPYAPA